MDQEKKQTIEWDKRTLKILVLSDPENKIKV